MLTTLFEAARVHGTTIHAQARPADENSQSGQESWYGLPDGPW
jgi:hypothetical protein